MRSSISKSFLPNCKSSFLQKFLAILTITFFIVFLKIEIVSKFNTNFIGGVLGDAGIYVWLAKLFPTQLLSSSWFETNGFYPYSLSVSFSDNWIVPSALIYLLSKINFGFVTSYNIIYLCSLVAAGYFTYLLLYSLSGNFLISIIAAVTASNLAPFQHHLGHPQLQHYWILPLVIYLSFRWVNSKRPLFLLALGFSLSISFLCSVYLTLFAGYLFLAILLIFLLLRPSHFNLRDACFSLIAIILGLVPCVPFVIPYLHLQRAFGSRFYYEPWTFQATPASYLSFGPFSWQSSIFSFSHSEAHLGIGAILLTLALSGFAMTIWSYAFKKTKWYLLASIIGLLIASSLPELSPILSVLCGWGVFIGIIYVALRYRKITATSKISFFTNQEILFLLFSVTLIFLVISFGPINSPTISSYNPYFIFYQIIPGLDGIRSVSRFGLVTNYLCCILGFFVLALLQARQQVSRLVVLGLSFFILAENYTTRFPLEELPKAPLAFTNIKNSKSVGITLPYGGRLKEDGSIDSFFSFAKRNILSTIWTYDNSPNLKLVNGFSGVKTKLVSELPLAVFDFPSENSIRILSSFVDLDTIIILPEFFDDNNSRFKNVDDLIFELNTFTGAFQDIHRANDNSLLIKFNSNLDLSAPVTLLTNSKSNSIKCRINSVKFSSKQLSLCDPSLFNIVQIPGNLSVPFRCSTSGNQAYLNIFPPPALKKIPANSIRVTLSKFAETNLAISNCSS